jgi:hypothetical protein
MDVQASARSLATLAVLGVLFVAGVAWAWSAVTEPFPEPAETPVCVDEQFAAGSRLRPGDVLVNVMNSGGEDGLARTTSEALVRHGFGEGARGNAQAVPGARGPQVWTSDPSSPAARLVAGYLGPDAHVVEKATTQEGITVVVGNSFPGVVEGPHSVRVEEDTTVCAPYDPQVDG